MITLEQAKEICIKAHKGQWRNPKPLPKEPVYHLKDYPEFSTKGFFINPKGNKVCYSAFDGWTTQQPYSTHPIAVADMMETEEEKIVALLHDVIEDTDWTFYEEPLDDQKLDWQQYLIEPDGTKHKISCVLATRLLQLTHKKNQTYINYINKLIFNKDKVVIKVKLADIIHNLSDNPSNYAKKKYLKAIPILLKEI